MSGVAGSRASPSMSTGGAPVGVPVPSQGEPPWMCRSLGYDTNIGSDESVPATVMSASMSTPAAVPIGIIVSLVLGLPTVGPLLLKALIAQDMFLAGTIVLLLGVMTVIGTLVSDVILVLIDPRIRIEDT